MVESKENPLMGKIVSLCKRRGFIFQSSEIYGGINGFWDYGPLGAELKRNVKELWWNAMTRQRDDIAGLEATIIMSPQIWKASGHVDTFSDPMCDCLLTKKRFRADQVEPQDGRAYYFAGACDAESLLKLDYQLNNSQVPVELMGAIEESGKFLTYHNRARSRFVGNDRQLNPTEEASRLFESDGGRSALAKGIARSLEKLISLKALQKVNFDEFAVLLPKGKPPESVLPLARKFYQDRGNADPIVFLMGTETLEATTRFNPENGSLLTEPRPFNLMFKTYVGPVESEDNVAYLRPETAQAIFAQFKNVLETSRQKVPFGIAQVGKAFRNEVTPRNYTFRSREFEQMELEFFIKPDEAVEAISGRVASADEAPNAEHRTLNIEHRTGEVPVTRHPSPDTSSWGWEAWHKYWVEERIRFYEGIGLPRNTLVEYWQKPEELAHYARACVDILFKFPFSKRDENGELKGEELEGIAARSDFDLSQHARFSGKPMGVFDEELRTAWGKLPKEKQDELWKRFYENRKKYLTKMAKPDETPEQIQKQATEDANGLAKGQYIPHVIEPSAGVDRLILALICNAYSEVTETDAKGKSETRVILKFHPRVAPIKAGVLPLLKNKPELVKKAQEVRDLLRPWMNVFYDDAGSIGRRYARQDEAGTPFCVTVDFDTLGEKPELKDTVTIRHRDDGKQERIAIGELLNWLLAKIR